MIKLGDSPREVKALAVQLTMTTNTPISYFLELLPSEMLEYADIVLEAQKNSPH